MVIDPNDPEYMPTDKELDGIKKVQIMDFMMSQVKTLNAIVSMIDFETYLDQVSSAETILPILDPTTYMKANHEGSQDLQTLIGMYRDIKTFLEDMEAKNEVRVIG